MTSEIADPKVRRQMIDDASNAEQLEQLRQDALATIIGFTALALDRSEAQ
jgi:hypothetical protein